MQRRVVRCHFPSFVFFWLRLRASWLRFSSMRPLLLSPSLLSILIVLIWHKTEFPWHEYGRHIYIGINAGLGALVLIRRIRWLAFLWLISLTWFLATYAWPRS
jgi:hypothetical protein